MPENKGFFWTVSFHAGRFNELANAGGAASLGIESDSDIPSATLDFANERKPSKFLCDAIIEKLLECVDRGYVEDNLSLQPPDEILRYTKDAALEWNAYEHPATDKEMEEIMKVPNWDEPISWLDWISDMKEDEKAENLSMVYDYVHNYWKMGQTYEFRLFV